MRAMLQRDPKVYKAETIREVLAQMREASPYPEESLDTWMQRYSQRISRWDGQRPIDCSTPETFWAGLIHRGELRELQEDD